MSTDTSYESAVSELNALQSNASVISMLKASRGAINIHSLPEMRVYWKRLGHELEELNHLSAIHLTGTKGKGSTCAFVDSILRNLPSASLPKGKSSLRVGLFTSPHLMEVRERIRIDGRPISKATFAASFKACRDRLLAAASHPHSEPLLVDPSLPAPLPLPPLPSYFRFLTLMAFHTFLEHKVDVAIIEVGVGGEYDSTNILPSPVACGITSLGLDHIGTLGANLESIAWHKAGIMKKDVPVIISPQPAVAEKVLEDRAKELHVSSYSKAPRFPTFPTGSDLKLGISGDHQVGNASLAIALVFTWLSRMGGMVKDPCPPDGVWQEEDLSFVRPGLEKTFWPGRAHIYTDPYSPSGPEGKSGSLQWCFDGAHTIESMEACLRWFSSLEQPKGPFIQILIFNCTHGREGKTLLQPLVTAKDIHFDWAFFCTNTTYASGHYKGDLQNNVESKDTSLVLQTELAQAWCEGIGSPMDQAVIYPTIEDTLRSIRSLQERSQDLSIRVLVTGSLHLVGGVMAVLGMGLDPETQRS